MFVTIETAPDLSYDEPYLRNPWGSRAASHWPRSVPSTPSRRATRRTPSCVPADCTPPAAGSRRCRRRAVALLRAPCWAVTSPLAVGIRCWLCLASYMAASPTRCRRPCPSSSQIHGPRPRRSRWRMFTKRRSCSERAYARFGPVTFVHSIQATRAALVRAYKSAGIY